MKRILAPTDFSPLSRVGLEAAILLIKGRDGSALTVVHVVEPLHLIGTDEVGMPTDVGLDHRINEAEKQMKLLRFVYKDQCDLETRVSAGHPVRTICALADDKDFDLIVLTSHGRTGLARMFIGSVAEHVVQDACCSVLVVKPRKDAAGELVPEPVELKLKRLIIGYDHRPGSERALEIAIKISQQIGGKITLVQALEPPNPHVVLKLLRDEQSEFMRVEEALEKLDAVKAKHRPDSVHWEVKAEIGQPWDLITACAKESAEDLIIVGPHEHTRWGHCFIGSTAQRVVRLAPCAVLAVK